jgi:hypothetical protein
MYHEDKPSFFKYPYSLTKQKIIANMLIADARTMVLLINWEGKVHCVTTDKMNGINAIAPTVNDIAKEIRIIYIFLAK